MIEKLRKRIFWIIQISLSVMILSVVVLFASFNYKNTIDSSRMFMDKFEEREKINEGQNDLGLLVKPEPIDTSGRPEKPEMMDDETFDEIKEFEAEKLKTTIIVAISVSGLGIILSIVIAKKLSEVIVKPVEASFEKQKQFVSDASHELKTPLAVIEANADVLQEKVGESKWVNYIQDEVHSMNKLVNDLLTLAKMENVNSTNTQNFDLSKETQMAVAVFESMIFEKGIKLETNIEEKIFFNGEREDIKHIISIILDNAIKHTEKDNQIVVNLQKEKSDIKFEIKNQGEPIPEEEREKIFERFYRIDKARNRNEKRYGLGLSIAKQIVDKYNGTIKASSKDGFTSFVVKLNSK